MSDLDLGSDVCPPKAWGRPAAPLHELGQSSDLVKQANPVVGCLFPPVPSRPEDHKTPPDGLAGPGNGLVGLAEWFQTPGWPSHGQGESGSCCSVACVGEVPSWGPAIITCFLAPM